MPTPETPRETAPMRLKLGLFLAALTLAACAQQPAPQPEPAPRTGSPNFQQGQPANPDAAVRPLRGRN
jgi:hypothetical protein